MLRRVCLVRYGSPLPPAITNFAGLYGSTPVVTMDQRPGSSSKWRRGLSTDSSLAKSDHPLKYSFDFKKLKLEADSVKTNAINRGTNHANVELVLALYDAWCSGVKDEQRIRHERNENAALMKRLASSKDKSENDRAVLEKSIEQGKSLKDALVDIQSSVAKQYSMMMAEAAHIPNDTHPDVPIGAEEESAVIATFGEKRVFEDFKPLDHTEIGKQLGLMEFEAASHVSGTKFCYLMGKGAMLELALVSWAMKRAEEAGFIPVMPPELVRRSVVDGCGFEPKSGDASQVYQINGNDLALVGTSEIPLAGMCMNAVLKAAELPKKYVAFSHCFRTEAGSTGKQTKGLYRLHQFSKVELFAFGRDLVESEALHREMLDFEISLYQDLGLHFKVYDMASRELGLPAYRKYDIEAYMPGRESYGEISSTSNCTDFQARRLNAKFKCPESGKNKFLHTVNGTAVAVHRLLVALLEQNQNKDGSVQVPTPLQPFMGCEVISQ